MPQAIRMPRSPASEKRAGEPEQGRKKLQDRNREGSWGTTLGEEEEAARPQSRGKRRRRNRKRSRKAAFGNTGWRSRPRDGNCEPQSENAGGSPRVFCDRGFRKFFLAILRTNAKHGIYLELFSDPSPPSRCRRFFCRIRLDCLSFTDPFSQPVFASSPIRLALPTPEIVKLHWRAPCGAARASEAAASPSRPKKRSRPATMWGGRWCATVMVCEALFAYFHFC